MFGCEFQLILTAFFFGEVTLIVGGFGALIFTPARLGFAVPSTTTLLLLLFAGDGF